MFRLPASFNRRIGARSAHGVLALSLWLSACGSDAVTPRVQGAQAGATPLPAATGGTAAPLLPPGRPPAVQPLPAPMRACTNLQCRQSECVSGRATTISGTVFDPAGKNPLYNVAVYVPNDVVQALPQGASCDRCDALYSGKPIAAALTDANGRFTLEHAPDGPSVPLVIQVGKWRKQVTVPSVTACQDNPLPDGMLRLPRNHSEGDIPHIAISTGMADTLECLLRRIGVDAAEYMPGAGTQGRIHIFQGSARRGNGLPVPDCMTTVTGASMDCPASNTEPPAPRSSDALWSSKEQLMNYDVVLLSCEGEETHDMNQQALHDYASAGGRVFASHYHYAWFNTGPYATENLAQWSAGGATLGDINGSIVSKLADGSAFPKGVAMQQWLGAVHALTNGMLPIKQARYNADVSVTHTASQPWIVADPSSPQPGATQYFSFNTPTHLVPTPDGSEMACGRVVFSDLHVGAASGDMPRLPVPGSCKDADLSPQEKALEFMLFDLSSCITPDRAPPSPPALQ